MMHASNRFRVSTQSQELLLLEVIQSVWRPGKIATLRGNFIKSSGQHETFWLIIKVHKRPIISQNGNNVPKKKGRKKKRENRSLQNPNIKMSLELNEIPVFPIFSWHVCFIWKNVVLSKIIYVQIFVIHLGRPSAREHTQVLDCMSSFKVTELTQLIISTKRDENSYIII